MLQQIIPSKFNNKLEEQLLNLFHSSNLPLHFNKTGYKDFTNYHRISIIILFRRSKKSLRDFVNEIWMANWRRRPRKSLHCGDGVTDRQSGPYLIAQSAAA